MAPHFQRLLVFSFAILAVALTQEAPELSIQPATSRVRKDLNGNGFFTCNVRTQHEEHVTDIMWLDHTGAEVPAEPQNRVYTSNVTRGLGLELYVTKIRNEDSGTYTCKARYGSGKEVTKSFELFVFMSIRFEDAPLQQHPVLGSDALIKCIVLAIPPAIVEWFRGTEVIPDNDKFQSQKDGLLIRNISPEDDGTYTCRAKVPDEGAMEERSIEVEVYTPPKITDPKVNAKVTLTEDEVGITRCMATGKPEPTRAWVTADGTDAAQIDGIWVDEEEGTLRFAPARRDMAGEYRCVASNAVSSVEAAVRVAVFVKPEIISYANVTSAEGGTAHLECHVTGSPLPTVTFHRVGAEASFEEGVSAVDQRINVRLTEQDRVRIAVMTITALTRADGGLYECVAANDADGGVNSLPARLSVYYAPSVAAVSAAEVYTWPDHPANLSCAVQAVPNATVTWKFGGRIVEGAQTVEVDGKTVSTLSVTPIYSEEFGVYTCQATNNMDTVSLNFDLRQATEPGTLTGVSVRELTSTSVKFDIPSPENDGGLPILRFLIQHVREGIPWPSHVEVAYRAGQQYVVRDLNPEDTYQFRFAAENAVGLGQWSETETQTMPKIAVPQPPTIDADLGDSPEAAQYPQEPRVVPSTFPNSYVLSWSAGADNGAEILDFQVSYYKVVNIQNRWRVVSEKFNSVVAAADDLSFRLSSLKPESFYHVELRARNRIGLGDPAQIIVHTARGVAAAPTSTSMASGVVIGVVIGVLLVLIILIDLTCYAVNNKGITHALCARGGSQSAKLTEEVASEKEPLQTNGSDGKPATESNGERDVPDVTIDKAQLDAAKDSAV